MSEAFRQLTCYLDRMNALQTANVLFSWDDETQAPEEATDRTAKVVGSLAEEYFRISTSKEVKDLLEQCSREPLYEVEAAIVRETAEELEKLAVIPAREYREFAELTARSTSIWSRAKQNNNFQSFAPVLKEIIGYQKKFASYRAKEGQKLYDVMLEEYEKGFDMERLDHFFETLKQTLVPLRQEVMNSSEQIDDSFLIGNYPAQKQEALARMLAEYLGFDFKKGVMAVSAHPFTTNLHNHDVRITTHYTDRVDSSVFSVIHETGHALYEFGIADELTQTPVGQGASMAMHESQSRFFENMIGRRKAFWKPLYGKVQEYFPEQLGSVTLSAFIRAINKVTPGLIRTEADELSYSLHVMIRYELEKDLIEGELDVEDLPKAWADKYETYLGIRPDNDVEGVLQDIHWSQGSFGYFPSYALGSAFAAQIYAYMKKQMDMKGILQEGKLERIVEYLAKHIHQYGKLKTSRELLENMTGEAFNPEYYCRYLSKKYRKLYCLEKSHAGSETGKSAQFVSGSDAGGTK